MVRIPGLRAFAVAAVLVAGPFIVACGDDEGEDRPNVDVISGASGGSVSVSGTGDSASVTGAPAEDGIVEAKPADATQIDVTLSEFAIATSEATVEAGQVYFLVENTGPDDPHEFVVIKTDLAPDALPVAEGVVPEEEVDLLDEIEPFAPDSSASLTLDLEAGSYVLICNIAEMEAGALESHYEEGMRTAFTVE